MSKVRYYYTRVNFAKRAVAELIIKRGQVKANLTRFSTFFKKCQEDPDNNLKQLSSRLARIKPILEDFSNIQDKIELLDKDDKNKDDHLRERIKFEDDYFLLISEAEALLDCQSRNSSPENTSVPSSIQSNEINAGIKFKLQPIEVPHFSGLYEDYQRLSDAWQSNLLQQSRRPYKVT
ncbi:hypothetical protein O3M35_012995 [Rhynocoris fuscipes]|uniref:Uncharacterized protein n=1 Tax=Rhynocoris fuscipes TaxID=488301 RepID=A0AAW1CE86_9HEMI